MILTDKQQARIAAARELAALPASSICAYVKEDDSNMARAMTLGAAQYMLAELLAIIDGVTA